MGTVLVVLFLLAVCGLIAYIGDLLGRRMGKKRLSAFGLRPKHTAILFTVITGVLIACVSLGAAFGVSPGVRLALTQGERLVLKNASLRRSVRALRDEDAGLTKALRSRQAEVQRLQRDQEGLRARNAALQARTATLQEQFGRLTASVRRLDATNASLQARNHILAGENTQLAAREAALQGQMRELEASSRRVSGRNRALAAANGALAGTNRQLAAQRKTLAVSLSVANDQVAAAQRQLRLLQDRVVALNHTTQRLSREDFIFNEREEIARRVLPPSAPPEVIRSQIETLLYEVRHLAAERKAEAGEGHTQCAFLAPLQLWAEGRERTVAAEPEIIQLLVNDSRAYEPDSIVLRAVSKENCLAGGAVPVEIQVFRNRLVLRRGEALAAQRIDGRDSEGTVLGEIVSLLRNEVRVRALKELGMIPGPLGEVGEMQFDPLLEVMRKVREVGGMARIGAVARQDTWSAGQLTVDFYVVPEAAAGAD